ncbi:uncharacterized protein LOC110448344 isoform X2 [Mizuhopecten yessoensis]|uniref:uncharacterized protein LOC110448344 isoform X2 n=1 Tax=Mizuhopecten yessoensis TaxID=6573 RepID=UPI000B45AAAC|nr:uncharacterized protein LOC110448344 isoform X2 [Mizuhopecten yessoensis]
MTSQKMLLIFIILLLQISDTTGSECSDAAESNNIPYIRMCEDGSVTSDKVILDTYRAGSTGETTCSCTVNARLIFTIYAQRYGNGLNPNTSRCGSEVVVNDTSSGRERSFTCNTSPEQILYSRPMTITWSGGPCGDSKYCLNIKAVRCSCDEEGTIHLSVPAFATIIVFMCLIMLYATVVTILYDRRCLSSKNQHQNDNTNGTSSNIPGDEGYVNMPLPPSSDVLHVSDTTGSECSDVAESYNIPYIRMCEDGSVTSDKVILDTHSAGATGETTCSCTVNATLIFVIYIQHYGNELNPSTTGCGSEVVVNDTVTSGEKIRSFTCNTIAVQIIYSRPMTITWSGGPSGDSKYCLNITGYLILPNTTFTITCSKPETTTTPPSTRTSTTTVAKTTSQTTNHTEKPSTTDEQTTPVITNVSNTDQGTASAGPTSSHPTSSLPSDTSTQSTVDSLPLIIVIPTAAGGFLLIVIILIIAIVCSRKHGKSSKGRESYIDDTIDPYGTSNPITSATGANSVEERDGMKKNILYDTSHHIPSNGNYSTVQLPQSNSTEVEYAQVKKTHPKQSEEGEQNEIELSNLSGDGNDLYAVVNKPKKNKPDENATRTSNTTDEGLIYVKVDTTGLDDSVRRPSKPDDSKDTDNTDTYHVAYAQVVVT